MLYNVLFSRHHPLSCYNHWMREAEIQTVIPKQRKRQRRQRWMNQMLTTYVMMKLRNVKGKPAISSLPKCLCSSCSQDTQFHHHTKYIVFEECLLTLFEKCQKCRESTTVTTRVNETFLQIHQPCVHMGQPALYKDYSCWQHPPICCNPVLWSATSQDTACPSSIRMCIHHQPHILPPSAPIPSAIHTIGLEQAPG